MTGGGGMPFGDFQNGIYLAGLGGAVPALPTSYAGLEAAARDRLEPGPFGYVAGGAGEERTMAANRAAFDRWAIVPRHLRGVARGAAARDLSVDVLGTTLPAPVLLAPIGVQSIIHPDAEVASARAAASLGVPFVYSSAASRTLEEVAAAMKDAPRWFQLYWPADPQLADSFLARAAAAGYGAVVVTLDTMILGWRPRDLASAYLPFLRGEGCALYFSDPVFRAALDRSPEEDRGAAIAHFLRVFSDPSLGWSDLDRLRTRTALPLVAKGILHPDDARRARDAGCDAVIVSNHGGRQIDGAVAALDALPDVVDAVGGDIPVLMDSGIRTGGDVLKALAMGATAVLLGRPYAWGLALGGEEGVRFVVASLLADLDLTLGLSGHQHAALVGPELLARVR